MEFAWQVSFPEPESNYNVDLSFNVGASFTQEETSATRPYTFDTPNALGQQLILVRWDSFPAAGISNGTNADSGMCNPALLPPPTILPLCQAASGGYDWQVSSSTKQVSWSIDLRYSPTGDWTYYASTSASFVFEMPEAEGKTLYVRWAFYPGAGTSTAHASTTRCT
jgi:outer membrane receptor protein involved in Fe transport